MKKSPVSVAAAVPVRAKNVSHEPGVYARERATVVKFIRHPRELAALIANRR